MLTYENILIKPPGYNERRKQPSFPGLRNLVLEAFREAGRPLNVFEVMEKTGADKKRIQNMIGSLKASGRLTKERKVCTGTAHLRYYQLSESE